MDSKGGFDCSSKYEYKVMCNKLHFQRTFISFVYFHKFIIFFFCYLTHKCPTDNKCQLTSLQRKFLHYFCIYTTAFIHNNQLTNVFVTWTFLFFFLSLHPSIYGRTSLVNYVELVIPAYYCVYYRGDLWPVWASMQYVLQQGFRVLNTAIVCS